ncbi:hypothetical protein BC826DRAFT_968421 [Russula brevipes]|nr:hypothetical protein BC826DRAFT_968421 [Russula brevipes]
MSTLIFRTLLPALLFTSLAFGAHHFLTSHLVKSGGAALLTAQCPPNEGPYSVRYVGLEPLDRLLCILVTFFQSSFDPTTFPFAADFLASWSAPIALTFVEAARTGRSALLACPACFGLLYQIRGAGFAFPLFWLALVVFSGHARLGRGAAARIDQARAEAALFAVLAGYALPSALMVTLQDPVVTALWQFFPAWMWIAQAGHLFFRPSARYNTSGYWTVQATFIFTCIASAISHIAVLWAAKDDLALLSHLYVPPVLPLDPATTTLQLAAHVFLQWDAIFTFSSSLLGTLWFASNAKQAALIALWDVIATVIVGPGAAVSGVLLWREWRLNRPIEEVSKKE